MTARIKISQAGLSAGVAGQSRTDGLATGALVTLEDVSGTGLSTFHLLWGPPEDTTAEASLAATGDPDIWTFSPTAAAYGSYEVELRVSGVPVERRIFGVRTPANHLLIPALNERASRHAGWANDGADQIDLCEQNANDFPLTVLNSFRYAGWWRSLYELYKVVEAGTGGIADHALALIKLVTVPAKSFLVNASNAVGNVATLAGSAAYQYARVNSANNALEMATLAAHASTSVLYDAGTNTWQSGAKTGAVTAGQNSNTFAFGALAAKSILANATNGSAVPAALAGSAARQYYRVTAANTGLEVATLADAVKTTAQSVAALTTVLATTGTLAVPAGQLAVGSRFKVCFTYQFVRGATATPLNLNSFLDINIGVTGISTAQAAKTAAGTYNMRVEAEFTVLSLGAAGSCMATMTAWGSADSATPPTIVDISNAALALDTTAPITAISIRGAAQMNTAVAGTSITATGGHVEWLN